MANDVVDLHLTDDFSFKHAITEDDKKTFHILSNLSAGEEIEIELSFEEGENDLGGKYYAVYLTPVIREELGLPLIVVTLHPDDIDVARAYHKFIMDKGESEWVRVVSLGDQMTYKMSGLDHRSLSSSGESETYYESERYTLVSFLTERGYLDNYTPAALWA
jgi:hypothetical protein